MNNYPINSTINSTTVVELADASSHREKLIQKFFALYWSLKIAQNINGFFEISLFRDLPEDRDLK